jgi:ribonuclease HI
MTLWRIWHIRNEIVHGKKPPPMEASRQFLLCSMDSLLQIKYHSGEDMVKGKFIMDADDAHTINHKAGDTVSQWIAPPVGQYTLNTDGSFGTAGDAGAGMVVRDHNGSIILSACRQLRNCRDALEAELCAVREGLSLAMQWCNQPLILETDCLEIVKMIRNEDIDRSVYTTLVEDIKSLRKDRHFCFTHIKRVQNISSHFMANYARLNRHTELWHLSGPEGLRDTCQDFVISDIP